MIIPGVYNLQIFPPPGGGEFFQVLGEGFQVRETNWGKEKIRREEEKKRRRKKRGGERGKQNERK